MILVSYDIADDKLRTQFSKFLRKYGNRMQFSVYKIQNSKRLLDIISVKEQKELAKDIKHIGNNETTSFWDKFFNKFKR